MGYKLDKTLKDNKKNMIIVGVLWVILSIVLVAPIAYSIGLASVDGSFNISIFIENVVNEITSFTSLYWASNNSFILVKILSIAFFADSLSVEDTESKAISQ